MPERPDLDEPFSLHPLTGEQAVKKLLGVDDDDLDGDPEDDET